MSHIFISYSRKDIKNAEKIVQALAENNLDTWIDWESIPKGEDWEQEIYRGIEEAEAFLFLISPDAIESAMCGKEIKHAVGNGKRVLPIVIRDADEKLVHTEIAKRNWIFCRDGQDNFEQAINEIQETVQTDYKWLKFHTELQVKALKWEVNKDTSRLVRGKELREAEEQLASTGIQIDPQPTELQRQFILESRQNEDKQRRRITSGLSIGLVIVVALAIFALWQLRVAQARNLLIQAQLASEQGQYQIATLLALESQKIINNDDTYDFLARLPFFETSFGYTLIGHTDRVQSVAWSPDGQLASASSDGSIILWDTNDIQSIKNLRGHQGTVSSIAWSLDGQLASGSSDNTVILWDIATEQPKQILQGHTDAVLSVAWSPDGQLASGSYDSTVILWDIETGQPNQILQGHTDSVLSVAWSPDGQLASSSSDGTVILWNILIGQPNHTLQGYTESIPNIAWSPDGQFAFASFDGIVTLWNTETGRPSQILQGNQGILLRGMAWSKNGQLASGIGDKVVVWDTDTGQSRQTLQGHSSDLIRSVAWSSDGQLASASYDGTVILWNTQDGQPKQILQKNNGAWSIAWSLNGQLASASGDGTVIIWDTSTWLPYQILQGHIGWVRSVAWSPEGQLASASSNSDKVENPTIIIWETSSGLPQQTLLPQQFIQDGHPVGFLDVAWSPDGQLASASGNQTIIWNVHTGQPNITLLGHTDWVYSVAWSSDSQLASASNKEIIIWSTHTGQPNQILRDFIDVVAWSPDGRIATSNDKGDIVILDPHSRDSTQILQGWDVRSVAWSPDGKLAISSNDRFIRIVPEKYTHPPCSWVGRNLTIKEWIQFRGNTLYRPTCSNLPSPDLSFNWSQLFYDPVTYLFLSSTPAIDLFTVTITGWVIVIGTVIILLGTIFLIFWGIFRAGKGAIRLVRKKTTKKVQG